MAEFFEPKGPFYKMPDEETFKALLELPYEEYMAGMQAVEVDGTDTPDE